MTPSPTESPTTLELLEVYSKNDETTGGADAVVVNPLARERTSSSSSERLSDLTGNSTGGAELPITDSSEISPRASTSRFSISIQSIRDSIPRAVFDALTFDKTKWWWDRKVVSAGLLVVFWLIIICTAATVGKTAVISPVSGTTNGNGQVRIVVSPSGSDLTGDGSYQRPYASISRASLGADGRSSLPPGSIVLVSAGTYLLTAPISTSSSGTVSQRIVFMSIVPWGAKLILLQPLNAASQYQALWLNNGSYVNIQGFELQLTDNVASGIVSLGSSNVRVSGNYIHGSRGCSPANAPTHLAAICSRYAGLGTRAFSAADSNNYITSNLIAIAGPSPGSCPAASKGLGLHGIHTEGHCDVLANNFVLGAPGNGLQVDCLAASVSTGQASLASNCAVMAGFNLVANASLSALSIVGAATNSSSPRSSMITANIFVHSGGYSASASAPWTDLGLNFRRNLYFDDDNKNFCTPDLAKSSPRCVDQAFADPAFASAQWSLAIRSLALGTATRSGSDSGAVPRSLLLQAFSPRCEPLQLRSPIVGGAESQPSLATVDFLGRPIARTGPVDIGPLQHRCN